MESAFPSLRDVISEELKCAFCLHRLKKPRALGCLHIFCEECLSKYVDEKAASGLVVCPLCQKETTVPEGGVTSLPSDFRAVKLIEVLAKEEKQSRRAIALHTCDVCGNSNSKGDVFYIHCSECAQVMCVQCGNAHRRMRITQSHTVAPVSNREPTDAACSDTMEEDSKNTCPKHEDNKLDIFCTKCLVPICEECITTDHPSQFNHRHILLSDVVPTMREQISARLAQVAEKSTEYTGIISMINSLESTMAIQEDVFEKKVEVAVRQQSQHISRWKQEITSKRGRILEFQQRELTKLRQQSEMIQKSIEINEIRAKDVLEHSKNHMDLALSFRSLRESLDQTLLEEPNNSGLDGISKAVSQLQFHVANDEPRIGKLVFPIRERRNIAITDCCGGPYAVTFTRDGRVAVLAKFSGVSLEPREDDCYKRTRRGNDYTTYSVKHHESSQYLAIKQTEKRHESSAAMKFGMEIRLDDRNYHSLASLSDFRFAMVAKVQSRKFKKGHPAQVFILNDGEENTFRIQQTCNAEYYSVSCVVTDFSDKIYAGDIWNKKIHVWRPNGTLHMKKSISTRTKEPRGIAICPRDPDKIVISDNSQITVIDHAGSVLRTISHPAWKDVVVAVDNDRLIYVLWKDAADLRTLQRYSMEGFLIDTLFEREQHECSKLRLAVSPGGTASVVTGGSKKGEIALISTTREYV